MKSSAIIIIGGIIVVGAVAYGIYEYSQGKKGREDSLNVDPIITRDESDAQAAVASEFSRIKAENASTISERHSEASRVICDSLQTIFNDNYEDANAETDETLDRIDSKLDDLLK